MPKLPLPLNIPIEVREIKVVTFITPPAPLILRGGIFDKFGEIQMLKCQNYYFFSFGFWALLFVIGLAFGLCNLTLF